jgi:hypothetical protein
VRFGALARSPAGVAFALVALLVAGCRLPSEALDGPIAVPLRITPTATTVEIDAPGWYAADTVVYLCSAEPPALPEPGPAREGWTPGGACHDYGHVPSADGLTAVLALAELTEAERPVFEAVANWSVLLVGVEGDRATSAIHTSFAAPIRSGS